MSLPVPYVSQPPNITPAQRRQAQYLVMESLSENTKASYALAWRNFCAWCDRKSIWCQDRALVFIQGPVTCR